MTPTPEQRVAFRDLAQRTRKGSVLLDDALVDLLVSSIEAQASPDVHGNPTTLVWWPDMPGHNYRVGYYVKADGTIYEVVSA